MNRVKCVLVGTSAVAAFAASAQAQDTSRPSFNGARVEAVVGANRDFLYGGAVGYDLQRGKAVFGVEGELAFPAGRLCSTITVPINGRYCARGQRETYIGGRLGIVIGPGTLLYAKAGFTNLRQRFAFEGVNPADNFRVVGSSNAARVGAGVEHMVGPMLYVKGEYRYAHFQANGSQHEGVVGIGLRF